MPELCGSTRLSTSNVAIAASAAVPPFRRISAPAAAARGSAALTMPAVDVAEGADVVAGAAADVQPATATSAANIDGKRQHIPGGATPSPPPRQCWTGLRVRRARLV